MRLWLTSIIFCLTLRGIEATNYPVVLGDLQLPLGSRLKLQTLENYQGQPFEEVCCVLVYFSCVSPC